MSIQAADADWENVYWLLEQFVRACDDVSALNGVPEAMVGTHRKPLVNMNLLSAAVRVVRLHKMAGQG